MNIDLNDPRLTAFALGELTGDDLTEIANAIEESVELQGAVDEILATADHLTDALASEAAPILTPEQRQQIESAAGAPMAREPGAATSNAAAPTSGLAKNVRFVRRFSVPIGLAASLALASGAWYMLLPSLSRSRGLGESLIVRLDRDESSPGSTVEYGWKFGERFIDMDGDGRGDDLDETGVAGPAELDGDDRWPGSDGRATAGADQLGAESPLQWHSENRWTGIRVFDKAVEPADSSAEAGEAVLANLAGADPEVTVLNFYADNVGLTKKQIPNNAIRGLEKVGVDGNSSLNTPTGQPTVVRFAGLLTPESAASNVLPSAAGSGYETIHSTATADENGNGIADDSSIKDLTGGHRPELQFGVAQGAEVIEMMEFSGEEVEADLIDVGGGYVDDETYDATRFLASGGAFVQTLNAVNADSVNTINNNNAMAGTDLEFDHVNGQNLIRDGKGKQGAIESQPYGGGTGLIIDGMFQQTSQPQPTDGRVSAESYLVYDENGNISGARFVPGWYDDLDVEGQENAASSRAHWIPVHESTTPTYAPIPENPFRLVTEAPRSTFSIDVDTASYTNVRQMLNKGVLPPPGAVRIEEFINYFDYDYALPDDDSLFSVDIEVAECPWNADHRLVHIGLQGYDVTEDERPPANLVYLIDVSGSMSGQDRLPLLQQALTMLAVELTDDDSIGIVTYSDEAAVVLDATMCYSVGAIVDAVNGLVANGSTNGGAGLEEAYAIATENFIEGGINRVILATDGDFNVGVTSESDLVRLIEEQAKSGVFLTVLGFGGDALNDSMLEAIADKGNGHYAFIDSLEEAERLLVDRLGGAVMTIAKDVKIQIEFNPAEVSSYRLIGYENRVMPARDFNDDTKDAGDIGAGHSVTALYEIIPAGAPTDLPAVDPLVYQTELGPTEAADSGELLTIKLRYKDPDGDTSELIEGSVVDEGATFAEASEDFAFAASVAGFAMLLRKSEYSGELTLEAVLEMAEAAMDYDPVGDRAEFVALVARAIEITPGS